MLNKSAKPDHNMGTHKQPKGPQRDTQDKGHESTTRGK